MSNTNTSKQDTAGHDFLIVGLVYTLTTWCLPMSLRAGDYLHVDADTLAEVVRTEKHRGGTEIVHLVDGRQVVLCGGTDVAVFRLSA